MKRTLTAIAALLVISGTLAAQGMRMSPEDRAKMLKDSLALDKAQTEKVTAVYKESQDAMMNAFQSASGDRESMRGTMQEISKKADEKIKALLTDAQKKKFEEMIKNRPQRGMRPPRN